MTKEEIRQEAEERVNICTPYHTGSFIQGYIAGVESREEKIADIKANCDLAIEGRDIKIKELERLNSNQAESLRITMLEEEKKGKRIEEFEQQIEKMKCCGNCRFSESDTLNGTFCHREGCFVVASAKCKLWEM